MKEILLLLIFCFGFQLSNAQLERGLFESEKNVWDVVYLRDGSILKGKLISWELGEELVIKIASENNVVIPANLIVKVRQEVHSKSRDEKIKIAKIKTFNFRPTGQYNNLSLSFPMGSELGVSLTYALGYRFSRGFGIGAGLGIEDFELGAASQVVPIFLEARGYTSKKSISPYYSVRGGYGIPLTNDKFNVIDGKGGLMFHPEAGFRFGGNDVWFYMGAGLRFQKITYIRELPWWQEGIAEDDIQFKRVDIKFGMEF